MAKGIYVFLLFLLLTAPFGVTSDMCKSLSGAFHGQCELWDWNRASANGQIRVVNPPRQEALSWDSMVRKIPMVWNHDETGKTCLAFVWSTGRGFKGRTDRCDHCLIPCDESDGLGNLEPAATTLVSTTKLITVKLSKEIEKEVEHNEIVFASLWFIGPFRGL
ncbi:hypothetical protein SUGI_0304850 [Cryptomeria japonica]|nr:hypothetical protein SUGI_0304850 [Cryptomeria japonica]